MYVFAPYISTFLSLRIRISLSIYERLLSLSLLPICTHPYMYASFHRILYGYKPENTAARVHRKTCSSFLHSAIAALPDLLLRLLDRLLVFVPRRNSGSANALSLCPPPAPRFSAFTASPAPVLWLAFLHMGCWTSTRRNKGEGASALPVSTPWIACLHCLCPWFPADQINMVPERGWGNKLL
jgi:hypothetical protein